MNSKLTRRAVLREAWPLIIANATTPLLGLVDAAALGHFGSTIDLAAIALGALIFNFMYWGFGFLRMTTTGLVAQARGAQDAVAAEAAVARALVLGLFVGTSLLALSPWLRDLAFYLLHGGAAEESKAAQYFTARIWGAPAALSSLGATGLLIGLGRFRAILVVQLLTNGLNIALDGLFVVGLHWGAQGVGWGTAIAEWMGALATLYLARRAFTGHFSQGLELRGLLRKALARAGLRATLQANADIMLRTLAMLSGFAFFTNQGAKWGAEVLAANHLLLQFISLSAFFLDGFAHVAEAHLGQAKGARDGAAFDQALRRTSEVAGLFALLLAALFAGLGPLFLIWLTKHAAIVAAAEAQLLWTALYIGSSVLAFQLDGVFIGCGQTRAMRNTAWLSLAVFLATAQLLIGQWGNRGLWIAFVAYVSARGLTLALALPQLRRQLASD